MPLFFPLSSLVIFTLAVTSASFCVLVLFNIFCLHGQWSRLTNAEPALFENNQSTVDQESSCMSGFVLPLYFLVSILCTAT